MPDNLILITGNDVAQIQAAASKIILDKCGPAPDAFALDVYSETDAGPDPQKIIQAARSIQTPPFLGGTKTVWIKHFTGFASDGAKNSDLGKALKTLSEIIQKGVPDDVTLVMDGPEADKGKGDLWKTCNASGKVITLNKPDKMSRTWQADMIACIQKTALEKGLTLERNVVDFLMEVLGTDTARIDPELEKLACFLGNEKRPVTLEDAEQICVGQGEEFSWTFTGALGKRNLEDCLRISQAMAIQNKDPDRTARSLILSSVGFFRQSLQIQLFMNQRKISSPNALKQYLQSMSADEKKSAVADGMDFVSMNPFRIMHIAEDALRYKPQAVIDALKVLRDAQWQCISSATSPQIALENALFKII